MVGREPIPPDPITAFLLPAAQQNHDLYRVRLFNPEHHAPIHTHQAEPIIPNLKPQPVPATPFCSNGISFASVAAATTSKQFFPSLNFPARQHGTKDGKPSISFSSNEIQAGAKRHEFTLVAKFTAGRPTIDEIRECFENSWKLQGKAAIGSWNDGRHVLIILHSMEDVTRALASPLRKVKHSNFRLFRWSPSYNTRREVPTITAWIRLPGVPLDLYDSGFFKPIVSTFATFLDVDNRTKTMTNPSFARICVELDVTKIIPPAVWISLPDDRSYWQSIVCEGNLRFCMKCKMHWHDLNNCRKRQPATQYDADNSNLDPNTSSSMLRPERTMKTGAKVDKSINLQQNNLATTPKSVKDRPAADRRKPMEEVPTMLQPNNAMISLPQAMSAVPQAMTTTPHTSPHLPQTCSTDTFQQSMENQVWTKVTKNSFIKLAKKKKHSFSMQTQQRGTIFRPTMKRRHVTSSAPQYLSHDSPAATMIDLLEEITILDNTNAQTTTPRKMTPYEIEAAKLGDHAGEYDYHDEPNDDGPVIVDAAVPGEKGGLPQVRMDSQAHSLEAGDSMQQDSLGRGDLNSSLQPDLEMSGETFKVKLQALKNRIGQISTQKATPEDLVRATEGSARLTYSPLKPGHKRSLSTSCMDDTVNSQGLTEGAQLPSHSDV